MILNEIKRYLLDKDFEYIFRGTLPDMPDCAIGLFMTDSALSPDGGASGSLRIIVRQRSADDALLTATTVMAFLDSGLSERVIRLSGKNWCVSSPCGFPLSIGPDERGRGLAEVKFKLSFNITNDR